MSLILPHGILDIKYLQDNEDSDVLPFIFWEGGGTFFCNLLGYKIVFFEIYK